MNTLTVQILCFALLSPLSIYAHVKGTDLSTGKPTEVKSGEKGQVVIFISSVCPCSKSHIPTIKDLAQKFGKFSFVGVVPEAESTANSAKSYFRDTNLGFPIIADVSGSLAKQFHALRTPHAFLLNPEGEVLYKGGVTNSTDAEAADKFPLADALTDVKNERQVRKSEARVLGCPIPREQKNE